MSTTRVTATPKARLDNIWFSAKIKFAIVMGRFVHDWLNTYSGYKKSKDSMQAGPMTPSQIDAMVAELRTLPRSYVDGNQTPLTDAEVDAPSHSNAYGAHFIREVIETNKDRIKTVVSIGGQHDQVSSYLASKFPGIKFTSVDLTPPEMLRDYNRLYPQSPNWTLKSGNALTMLRDGSLSADLFFMQSVGFLMNSKEVDEFAAAFKGRAKFVAITEAWFSVVLRGNPFKVVRPEEIDPVESAVAPFYGHYNLYQHNYPAKFGKAGFQVARSELHEGGNSQYLKLDFLAVDPAK